MSYENIPEELQERNQWLLWDADADKPRQPHWRGDFGISWSDPDDWHTFEEVVGVVDEKDSWGIGYVTAMQNTDYPRGLYGVIDIDTGLVDGEPADWVPSLDKFKDAYIERSPSGTGLHIPFVGHDPPEWWSDCQIDDHTGVDVLTNKFCTFTGDVWDGHDGDLFDGNPTAFLYDAHKEIKNEAPAFDTEKESDYDGDGDLTEEQVREALQNVDPDLHYSDWLRVGMGVYDWDSTSTGKRLFENWSKSNPKWDPKRGQHHIDDLWENHSPNGDVTVGTLVYHAKEGGWTPPTTAKTESYVEDEEKVEETDVVFSPDAVFEAADASPEDANDRTVAYGITNLLRRSDDHHFLATGEGQIYQYDGGVWNPDGKQELRSIGTRAMGPGWGKNTLSELIEQIRGRFHRDREELGTPKNTVAVANGLLDVTTGELREHHHEHLALNKVPVAWDPDAEAPRWEQFLEESVEDGRVKAVEEYIGYCLLENQMPFARALLLVGGGSNGKSTLLNTVVKLLGEENTTGFSLGNLSHNEYYVAEMAGKLANIDADVTGGIGHGGMFKKITGGDRKVNARRPYGEPFDFHPTTKQLYSANEVPDADVDDDAFFRRWLIAEFPKEFTDPGLEGPDKDPGLEDKLEKELPGILRRAVEGVQRLLENGQFTDEGEIYEKRQRWQAWGDTVDKFISEHVETGNGDKIRAGDLYEHYSAYCRQEIGETPESQSTLTGRMKKVDGVKYSSDFRFGGKKARGFKGVTVGFELDTEDAEDDGNSQITFSQSDRMQKVRDAIDEVEDEDGIADVGELMETLQPQINEDQIEHVLDKMKKKGEITEPDNGKIRQT